MRSHPEMNKREWDIASPVDIHQMEMLSDVVIMKCPNTYNHQEVFKIKGEEGLYTFKELQNRLLN